MKKFLLMACLSICFNRLLFSQSATIPYQFYLDANNNCIYDTGEQLIYNAPGYYVFNYVNNSAAVASAYTGTTGICPTTALSIINYSLPATNTFAISNLGNYPGFVPNFTCGAYNNLSYANTTFYLPLKSANALSNMSVIVGGGTYTSSSNTFPVCANIGNDTVRFNFNILNLYSCNTGVSSRTYSLYLDGTKYEEITTTGLPYSNATVTGLNNIARLSETYMASLAYLNIKTKLPSSISSLITHTFAIKSSMIYNNALSVINYTCLLNSTPCTQISGKFYTDCNNNCSYDSGDQGLGTGVVGKVYNSSGFNMLFTPANNGNFSLFLPSLVPLSLTHYAIGGASSGFIACSTSTTTLPVSASTNTFLFGYKVNPYYNVSTYLHAYTNGVNNPGSNIKVMINTNSGNLALCGASSPINPGKQKVVLKSFLSYVSTISGPSPATIIPAPTGDTLVWNVTNFYNAPANSISIAISPTISNLTPFTVESFIYPTYDFYTSDNFCTTTGTVGAPFDPNSKEIYTNGLLDNGDIMFKPLQTFYYTINFQNVGTAPAVNVRTIDTIDVNFDLSTLKVLQSSYPGSMQIDNNSRQVAFMFDGINLADATSNEPASHGYVRYSIALKGTVAANTVIKNRGHNYFDFNPPVPTNQTANKLVLGAGIAESVAFANGIKVMPNPFSDQLSISSASDMRAITVYNSLGQLQRIISADSKEIKVDLSNLPPATVYFITIELKDGRMSSTKVIKN